MWYNVLRWWRENQTCMYRRIGMYIVHGNIKIICVSEIVTSANVQKIKYQTLAFASPLATDYWRADRRRHRWSAVHPGLGAPSTRRDRGSGHFRRRRRQRRCDVTLPPQETLPRGTEWCIIEAVFSRRADLDDGSQPTADAGLFHMHTNVYLIIIISVTLQYGHCYFIILYLYNFITCPASIRNTRRRQRSKYYNVI